MADPFSSLVALQPASGGMRANRGPPGVSPGIKGGVGGGFGVGSPYIGVSPAQGHVLDAHTAALWRFDEASATNPVDLTGHYTLTQYGSPGVVAGQIGNARQLDGTSMFFQRQGDAALGTVFNGSWTIEAWLYLATGSTAGTIFIYSGLDFTVQTSDVVLADFGVDSLNRISWRQWVSPTYGVTFSGGTPLSLDTWHHVALIRQELGYSFYQLILYLDGVSDGANNASGLTTPISGASHYIGVGNYMTNAGPGTAGGLITGRIDDMRISKVVRSPEEIKISYQRGVGG